MFESAEVKLICDNDQCKEDVEGEFDINLCIYLTGLDSP